MITKSIVAIAMSAVAVVGLPGVATARPVAGPDGKLDSHLRALAAGQRAHRDVVTDADRQDIDVSRGGRVLVDVYVRGSLHAAAGQLQVAGMEVKAATDRAPVPMVEGRVPLGDLDALARLSVTRAVLPVTGGGTDAAGGTDSGSVQSEGDASHRGPQARALGSTGAGVKVGVISDSIDTAGGGGGLAASQSKVDLPPSVHVISDDPGGDDEGRAMAEIIFDEAPGATFSFSSGTASGSVGKAAAIRALKADGVQIIADDIFYATEPFFQDGAVAQAVDEVAAGGVTYFASAGNRGRQSYEGTYAPGAGAFHDFGGGDTRQHVVDLPNGRFIQITLQWDEPFGAAATDLDAGLYDATTGALLAAGASDNLGTGLPIETVTYRNTTGGPVSINLGIKRFAGTRAPFMKYIARGNFGTFSIAEHDTASNTINPDAASARGSLAVAAVKYNDLGLNDPEPFSSRGVATRLFDRDGNRLASPEVRQKPQLAAADGVSTDLPAGGGLNPFFGTSAATPSAAGVAALAKSAKPSLSVAGLSSIMTDPANSVDCVLAGNPDTDCGFGFILADKAVTEALDPSPPVITSAVTPPAPNGTNGWYTVPVSVSLAASDAQSRVFSQSPECGSTPVTADGVATITCTATSAGGTASLPVTIKRDTTAPGAPAFTGLAPGGTYSSTSLPPAGAIACTATDATSGPAGCDVTGYSSAPGSHTLLAVARDQAGLTSSATATYSVLTPGLARPRVGIVSRSVKIDRRGRGAVVVSCSGGGTCRGSLRLRVRSGRRTLVIATSRFSVRAGRRARVGIRLSRTGRRRLAARRRLAVQAVAAGPNTARRGITLRR